jgi:peptidoglycan/xylan/chitin deacetylase (PgdA/CDA1 family)
VSRALLALAPAAVWAAYAWGSYLLPRGAWRGRRDGRLAALTFDDGPDPTHTPRVLDILAAADVPATFFLIGQRAVAFPDIARRIAAVGHDLGNHTWSHASLWLCGRRRTEWEIARGHEAIWSVTGRAPRFFRPPWGMTNVAVAPVLTRLGTPCVFWTVQPEGWRAVPPERQVSRALARMRPGAIVDLHDADGVTGAGTRLVRALPDLIRSLRDAGYTLALLRDLL